MTPPPRPGDAAPGRAPLLLLASVYAIPLVVAAVTPIDDFRTGPQGDIGLYLDKAYSVLTGLVPYRDFPLEYPPAALIPMTLPDALWPLGPPSLSVYAWLFAGQIAVLLLALGLVLGRIVRARAAWTATDASLVRREQRDVGIRLLVLAVGASLALTWRFDLFAVLLATTAVWAALDARPIIAGVAIGIGILAKLFPVVLAPALAVVWLLPLDWSRLRQFGSAVFLSVVLGMAPFVALAGSKAFTFIGYQADRGLQIESVGGGLVLLAGLLTGEPNALIAPFSAWEVTGSLARVLQVLSAALVLFGLGALGWLGWQRARDDARRDGEVAPATVVTLATIAVLLLVLTSKVFSIQYVVWLVPFLALLPWRQFSLGASAVALTVPIHPVLYPALVRQEALPVLVLNVRNGLLVALLAWLAWELVRRAPPRAGTRPEGLAYS